MKRGSQKAESLASISVGQSPTLGRAHVLSPVRAESWRGVMMVAVATMLMAGCGDGGKDKKTDINTTITGIWKAKEKDNNKENRRQYWGVKLGGSHGEKYEFLSDGSGIQDKGDKFNWKIENNRFYFTDDKVMRAWNYKLEENKIVFSSDDGEVVILTDTKPQPKTIEGKRDSALIGEWLIEDESDHETYIVFQKDGKHFTKYGVDREEYSKSYWRTDKNIIYIKYVGNFDGDGDDDDDDEEEEWRLSYTISKSTLTVIDTDTEGKTTKLIKKK